MTKPVTLKLNFFRILGYHVVPQDINAFHQVSAMIRCNMNKSFFGINRAVTKCVVSYQYSVEDVIRTNSMSIFYDY